MDSETLEQTWSNVCAQVKSYNNIDPTQISAFFSRLHPQAMSEGFLMLTADNDFIKTWIERNYVEFIKRALLDLYQVPFTVVVEVDITAASAPAKPAAVPAPAPQPPQPPSPTIIAPEPPDQPGPKGEPEESAPFAGADGVGSTYTFENFVIGDSNRMAYSMAVAVAEMPGKAHLNPLFLYGKSGLGKTHLMRAIQNYVTETMPALSVVYVDSAELLSDYMDASAAHDKEKSSYKNFKTRYEDADVLLIDDVQYLQGKKQTLDIVFQIFNRLTEQGRQVVLSADRAPKNIDIDERYMSRFNSGATFDIQPPEVETKLGIVKSFVDEYREAEGSPGFSIPDDIQMYIAESSSSNIRELKSAVTKVIYQMTFFKQPNLSLDDVRALLENHFSGGPSKRLTIADIQKEVETFYKVSHADLVGKKRNRNIIYARQIAIYLCRQMLDLPFNDIGKKFNRDHSTVMYSVTNVEEKMKENRELREELETLRQIIREI
ncbi:chromosomal replication initiator protein DnaA [Arabiibacter massiliensis]|uniref:chromosomal replication initiator protein DnaA n=1 Tax=Arabiibacter massiliensis TaxID=1870985 RepID=UPI0009B988BC|nr:chromosomal replication initiator protein DnaA [Arabiibacter massiliensis]